MSLQAEEKTHQVTEEKTGQRAEEKPKQATELSTAKNIEGKTAKKPKQERDVEQKTVAVANKLFSRKKPTAEDDESDKSGMCAECLPLSVCSFSHLGVCHTVCQTSRCLSHGVSGLSTFPLSSQNHSRLNYSFSSS